MLKIKDNIDLKVLEKYGFTYRFVGMDCAYIKNKVKGYYNEFIIVWLDRLIQVDSIEMLDILYDLIKFDYVEKVENYEKNI